jgi:hypothetical protein
MPPDLVIINIDIKRVKIDLTNCVQILVRCYVTEQVSRSSPHAKVLAKKTRS